MKPTLTVRVPRGIRAELERLSRAEGVAVSDLVRESIREMVAVRRFRKLRGQVLPFAEAAGLLTDEDVFRRVS